MVKMDLEDYCTEEILKGNYLLKNKWITSNETLKEQVVNVFPNSIDNFQILAPRHGVKEKHRVLISTVEGTPYEHLHDHGNTRIYAGGPGSMVGAALDSVLTHKDSSKGSVVYLNDNFCNSNMHSSGYYFHLRHSCALNQDPEFRGRKLALRAFLRQLQTRRSFLRSARRLGFWRIDLTMQGIFGRGFASALACTAVLSGMTLHTLKNTFLEKSGRHKQTDWFRNIEYSKASIPVLQHLESIAANTLPDCDNTTLLHGLQHKDSYGNSFQVVYDEKEDKLVALERNMLEKFNDIKSYQLGQQELEKRMGGAHGKIYSAYSYQADGRVSSNANNTLSKMVTANGHTWKEGVVIKNVFVDREKIRGIQYLNKQSNQIDYLPCTSAVLSLGYTARYEINSSRRSLTGNKYNPVGYTTVGTGCSGFALIKGRIPALSTQFSHWTEMEYSPACDLSLCKVTAGGNIGSEHGQISYALNLFHQTRFLFGDRFLGMLSIQSCPRFVNNQNDVQFYRLSNGLHICLGLGGTGMTKMGANGAMSVLLSNPHLSRESLIDGEPNLLEDVDLSKFVSNRFGTVNRLVNRNSVYSFTDYFSAY